MTRAIALLGLPLVVIAVACAPSNQPDSQTNSIPTKPKTETEKTFEYADELKKSVEEFESSRKDTANGINESGKAAKAISKTEKAELRGAARDWEDRWVKVKAQVKAMSDKLQQVCQKSLAYFDQLDKISGSISDANLRQNELGKNQALKDKWTKTYQAAAAEVNKLNALLVKGDDFHKILLGAAIRSELEKNIRVIEDVAAEASKVLAELSTLTEEGRKLAVN